MPRLGLPRSRRVCASAATLAALIAVALPAGTGASANLPTASASAVRAYWTPARMRAALPGSLLAPGGAFTAAAQPKRALHQAVAHPQRVPTRTAGKVFFSQGLYDYECSGTVVHALSRRLVLSAGHCAYVAQTLGGGAYGTHWMFVPAYKDGHAPFGKWAASKLVATPGWVSSVDSGFPGLNGGDSRFDVSAATLAPLHGQKIEDVVGARRIRFDGKRSVTYDAIGYPAEAPFNGKREFRCVSPYEGADHTVGSPPTISIACDMTGGSSGGGWIVGGKYIESVTSYGYNDDPNTLYGPYLGDAIHSFYASVKNG
jgi:V8-like Glu-specific endopeptidase